MRSIGNCTYGVVVHAPAGLSTVGLESERESWRKAKSAMPTLRDYGRFDLFLAQDGVAGGEHILPEGWVKKAGASKVGGGKAVDCGYMIWPLPDA